jgi:hypothetical protein
MPSAGFCHVVRKLPEGAAFVPPDLFPFKAKHFAGPLGRDQDHAERAADDRPELIDG